MIEGGQKCKFATASLRFTLPAAVRRAGIRVRDGAGEEEAEAATDCDGGSVDPLGFDRRV